MKKVDSNLGCPNCHNALSPKLLACDECGIKVEGPFQLNEFALLATDDLHFLRIFVRCEGKVRDMESALGLSYPTIRARLTALKNKLVSEADEIDPRATKAKNSSKENSATREILEQLEAGKLSFEKAMGEIKKNRSKK